MWFIIGLGLGYLLGRVVSNAKANLRMREAIQRMGSQDSYNDVMGGVHHRGPQQGSQDNPFRNG